MTTVEEASRSILDINDLFERNRPVALKRLAAARAVFESELSRDPDNPQANHNMGEVWSYLARDVLETREYDRSVEAALKATGYYEQAICHLPQTAERPKPGMLTNVTGDQRTYLALKQAQFGRAHALKLASDAYGMRGDGNDHHGCLELAERAYADFLTGPVDEQMGRAALVNLGNVQSLLGKFNEAETSYRKVLATAPPWEPVFRKALQELRVSRARRGMGLKEGA